MYLQPRTLDEACAALADAPAALLAGGTDFFPALGERAPPRRILDLSRIAGFAEIEVGRNEVRIGAGATWSQLGRADLPRCFDGLKAAAREIGSVQIQNVGTLAGNLCNASPAADGAPPLLALDARVELRSAGGVRQVALCEFLVGNRRTSREPGEILAAILVPLDVRDARSCFLKLGARRYLVISIAMAAAVVVAEGGRVVDARVAVGSCSAVAQRLPGLEAALVGQEIAMGLGRLVAPDHLSPLAPIDDLRATGSYRDEASLELVRRALDLCAGPA